MAEHSSIEWTDATWNPVTGCTLVSEGCRNCYAARLAAGRLSSHPSRAGLARVNADGVAKFTGEVRFNAQWLTQPLGWKRPRMIFVCAHGDLFAEDVPDTWIDQVFAVMALAPQHTFQVLTKRPQRMREYMLERWQPAPAQTYRVGEERLDMPAETVGEDRHDQILRVCEDVLRDLRLDDPDRDELWTPEGDLKSLQFTWPLPNVWLGTSIEDQANADKRVPELLATPAAVRFVSAEPLLGPIDLSAIVAPDQDNLEGRVWTFSALRTGDYYTFRNNQHFLEGGDGPYREHRLDWVIVGGESGPHARPMHPDWARSLRDQCAAAGVPFFFKQWGEWAPDDHFTHMPREDVAIHEWTREGSELIESRSWRYGKTAAGRTLDGAEHNGMPAPDERRAA